MRKAAAVLAALIFALLSSMTAVILQSGYCLPSNEYVYDDTAVYSLFGRGLNVTITANPPENKAHNSTVSFTLKILGPYMRGGGNFVNPSDYFLKVETLDAYLTSGVILDYDRQKIIDPLWIYWAQTLNATYVAEERALFQNSHDVVFSKSNNTYFGSAVLPELSEGLHNLTVWVRAEFNEVTTYDPLWAAISKTIWFTIDTVNPNVTVLVASNSTFKTSEVPLNFTVDKAFSKIKYTLDGKSNITISGNTTLPELPNGWHNVTVYATDEAGNTGASETLFFNVNAPESFPVMVTIAVSVTVITVAVGLLVYFRKRKQ
jgi:hypothetical protein